LDSRQVLSVIEKYNEALNLLDAYDHQSVACPKGNSAFHVLNDSLEEKAASLLYFVTKNHGFYDGNKRIAESRPEEKEMMISVVMNCIG